MREAPRLQRLVTGNLVRWRRGQLGADLGVVTGTSADGRQATVLLDNGEQFTFVATTDVIDRVTFLEGASVVVRNDGAHGVVTEQLSLPMGIAVYRVSFPDGSEKLAPEDSLRPAQITNPAVLLRDGQFGDVFSMNLRIAGTRLAIAHQFDELSSLSNSRVEIKPHQVGVLHRVAGNYPHRFLLADEVGLGKTIEAGLIIKELKARGMAKRVLVLAPSGIVSQWQFELKTKFNEVFSHYNRSTIQYLQSNNPGENVWTAHDNVIVSTSFAAYDEQRRAEIALAGWDLVVIDEAHHARRTWEGQNRYSQTQLYELASALADPDRSASSGYLLLTATPMQLHPFELYSLVELLDPALFADYPDFEDHAQSRGGLNKTVEGVERWDRATKEERAESLDEVNRWLGGGITDTDLSDPSGRAAVTEDLLSKHRLSDVLIRNRKSVVGGFMPREAHIWTVLPSQKETEAYEAVIQYVRTGYEKSRETRNNALGFLMATYQKMNASSSYTLARSLARRIEKLQHGLTVRSAPEIEEDDLAEQPSTEALGDVSGIESQLGVLEELTELLNLVELLESIEIDSKAIALRDGIESLRKDDPSIKVLVFTQFRDTQSYLESVLREAWTIRLFHGQLSPAEKDEAVGLFRDEPGPQVLISTEAGGEGRNLQFCHTMVNYDLPWNPMRIEQRIGRLDRIGQKHVVSIINLAVQGTIEERVLSVLADRIQVFEATVGGLDPILGSVEADLQRLFLAPVAPMASSRKKTAQEKHDEALAEMFADLPSDAPSLSIDLAADSTRDAQLSLYEADIETRVYKARAAETHMADLIMDMRSFRQDEVKLLLERKGALDSTAIERFVLKAMGQLGVRYEPDPELTGVYVLRFRGHFLQEFPELAKEAVVRRVTFDPSVALDYQTIEFLAFGHELVDRLVERVRSRPYGGTTGYRAIESSDRPPATGWFFTFALELEGVTRSQEILPVFIHEDGSSDSTLASWLLDTSSAIGREDRLPTDPAPAPPTDEILRQAEDEALGRLMERRSEMSAANRSRLEQERVKLERYFDYRQRAAEAKLASVQRTFDNISLSEDPGVQRIIPVWAKNLEDARRVGDALSTERVRRIGELAGRDQVSAQHEMLTGAFVRIGPPRGDQSSVAS